jgi:2-amino-4-hydroxy-6-hydroxymethyldihydropteridine diphosphokinase
MIVPVGIALGSNVGDRNAELNEAVLFLSELSENGEVQESPRIETTPVDCPPDSPVFLNSVAEIEIDTVNIPPLHLLSYLQEYEIDRGRTLLRDINAPREIDMDIIYYGIERIDQLGLVIPHPRAHLRRFVLEPLARLRPDLVLPGQTKSVQELLKEISAETKTQA